MKKKGIILAIVTLITGLLLGTINVSASETEKNLPDIEQYEKQYDSDLLVYDSVKPDAIPALVGSALVGGVIYDAAKKGITAFKNAHDKATAKGSPTAGKIDYKKKANQQGPWSVEDDYTNEFGR